MLEGKVHKYGARGLKGASPLLKILFPLMQRIHLPIMGRGIKGEGLIDVKR
jgi:hypothetical protein